MRMAHWWTTRYVSWAKKGCTLRSTRPNRQEHRYLVPTGLSAGLKRRAVRSGVHIVSAAHGDADRLRELDDALRQGVAGDPGQSRVELLQPRVGVYAVPSGRRQIFGSPHKPSMITGRPSPCPQHAGRPRYFHR